MAIIAHAHKLLKKQPNASHIDSLGVPFGMEEHEKVMGRAVFGDEDDLISLPLKHKHHNLDELVDPVSNIRALIYRPSNSSDVNRVIDLENPPVKKSEVKPKELSFVE